MKYISKQQIITINNNIVKKAGGYCGDIRDNNAFEIAYYSPFATAFGQDIHDTIIAKSARACFSFISNHPFTDGNKRIGIHLMLLILKLNDYKIAFETNELVSIAMSVAQNKINTDDIIKIIESKIKLLNKGVNYENIKI